jgi:MHS family shikimate/dehydroshikimate transporter-like MFS transporter
VFGSLSDIFGRRPVMIIGAIYTALCALVYFQIIGAGTPWIAVLMTAGHAFAARSMFGVQPSFYCDLFPPEVRYRVIAFAREAMGAVVLGPLPLVATAP